MKAQQLCDTSIPSTSGRPDVFRPARALKRLAAAVQTRAKPKKPCRAQAAPEMVVVTPKRQSAVEEFEVPGVLGGVQRVNPMTDRFEVR